MSDNPVPPLWSTPTAERLRSWIGPFVRTTGRFYRTVGRMFTMLVAGALAAAVVVWLVQPWTWPDGAGGSTRVLGGLALLVAFLVPAVAAIWVRGQIRVAAAVEPNRVEAEIATLVTGLGALGEEFMGVLAQAGEGGSLRKLKALNDLRQLRERTGEHVAGMELGDIRRLGFVGSPGFQLGSLVAIGGAAALVVIVLPVALLI